MLALWGVPESLWGLPSVDVIRILATDNAQLTAQIRTSQETIRGMDLAVLTLSREIELLQSTWLTRAWRKFRAWIAFRKQPAPLREVAKVLTENPKGRAP